MQAKSNLQSDLLEQEAHEEHWIAVSDLMSGLMMVFLLISVMYLVKVEKETAKIRDVAILYDHLRSQLYQDLYQEFEPDLPRWGAELNEDLSLRFYNSELLFAEGEAAIGNKFQLILADFFPRYISIITSDEYREDITEVRIEGHTSSTWANAVNSDEAYLKNMSLSQQRTRTTLGFLLALDNVQDEREWIRLHLTANGLSSSKLILTKEGSEDAQRSRRVEFVVKTDAEARIATILEGTL